MVFELENHLKDEEQTNTILKQEWHQKESQMERELTSLRDAHESLTGNNKKLER